MYTKPYIGIIAPFSDGEGRDRTFTRGRITKQESINKIWQIGGIPVTMHWKENSQEFDTETFDVIDGLFVPKGPLQSPQVCAIKYAINNSIPVLLEDKQMLDRCLKYLNSNYNTIKVNFPSNSSQNEIMEKLEDKIPILLVGSYKSNGSKETIYSDFIELSKHRINKYESRKPVVSIIPQRSNIGITKTVYTYPESIIDAGGIPLTIHMPIINKKVSFIKEALNKMDSILIPGGSIIMPEQICAVKYVIEEEIPFLGICAGMQTMGAYNWFRLTYGDVDYEAIIDKYNIDIDETYFMFRINSSNEHNYSSTFYQSNVENFLHPVLLSSNISKLYEGEYITNHIPYTSMILVPSVHNWALKKELLDYPNSLLKIIAVSDDKIIEAVELKNNSNIIGLQYHPELFRKSKYILKEDNLLYAVSHSIIFKNFINISIKNKQAKNKYKLSLIKNKR